MDKYKYNYVYMLSLKLKQLFDNWNWFTANVFWECKNIFVCTKCQ